MLGAQQPQQQQIDVELVLVLRYYYQHSEQAKQQQEQENDGWSADPSDGHLERLPNRVCAWADPFWTGLTCSAACSGSSSSSSSAPVSVFHVRGALRPRALSTLQALVGMAEEAKGGRSLCNSLKLHFFAVTRHDVVGEEERASFVYASALPLELLFLRGRGGAQAFGVFNYNRCDTSAAPLPRFELLALPVAPAPPAPGVLVYALPGPRADHHERTLRVSTWLTDVLERVCPCLTTDFKNMRTYCRDQHSTFLFQDLQRFFETPGTCLPPTIAVYAAHAALRLLLLPDAAEGAEAKRRLQQLLLADDDDASAFLRGLFEEEPSSSLLLPRLFMRFARDLLACFTLCAIEGLYWPDVSLSCPVEDQPTPLSFMPSRRVFTKDDCEGRACQVHQMVLLLRWMHRAAVEKGMDTLLRVIRGMRSFAILLSALDPDEFERLVRICVRMGGLLEQGVLDVQTVVGDVHFASMQSPVHMQSTTGHSFVVAFLRDPGRHHGMSLLTQVIEATGWERTQAQQAQQQGLIMEADAQRVQAALARYKQTDPRSGGLQGSLCGLVPEPMEDRIYERLVLGNGCIFFTARAGSRVSPVYGARLEVVRRGLRRYPHLLLPPHNHNNHNNHNEEFAFTITTRELLQALCEGNQLWPAQPGAKAVLADYERMEADLPAMRRCLRPPQKNEVDIERVMCASWGPAVVATAAVEEGDKGGGGLLFTVPTLMNGRRAGASETLHAEIEQQLSLLSPGRSLTSFPFMSSRIFCLLPHHDRRA